MVQSPYFEIQHSKESNGWNWGWMPQGTEGNFQLFTMVLEVTMDRYTHLVGVSMFQLKI